MSLSNCIQKAGKALNERDAESITNIADEIEASGVDRVDAEKQAIEQHLGTMQSDIDAMVPESLKQVNFEEATPKGEWLDSDQLIGDLTDDVKVKVERVKKAMGEDFIEEMESGFNADFDEMSVGELFKIYTRYASENKVPYVTDEKAENGVIDAFRSLRRLGIHISPSQAEGYLHGTEFESEALTLRQESDTDVETPRGSFEGLFTGDHTINLSEISDMSTFLHESMHLFVSMEGIFAKENGLSANNKAMLDHVGAKSFDELTVDQHESLAESFEVYLREGKAPSVAMLDAFHVFKKWLTTVYQNLRNLPRQKLDPELSQIFDRLLATEAEIAEVAAHPEYQEYFRSKEQAGMTDAQWTEYQQAVEKRKNRAEETVTEKIIKQLRNRKSKEWRQEKAPLIDQEMERLSHLPVYQILSDTRLDKMDYSLVHKIVGGNKKILGKLARNLEANGTLPEVYSEGYGYDSPAQMLKDIGDNKSLIDAAKDAAEAIMVGKYGDILNDGTIEQEAHEALSSDIDEKILLMELKAMNKGKGDINNSLLKDAARKLIGTMKQSDIKPDKYKRLERKAALRAERAEAEAEKLAEQYEKANAKDADKRNDKEKATIAKGKPPTADQIRFEAKKQQMANKHLYREATKQRKNIIRWTDQIKKYRTKKYSTKVVDGEFINTIKNYANLYRAKRKDLKSKDEDKRAKADEMFRKELVEVANFYRGQRDALNGRLTQDDVQLEAVIGKIDAGKLDEFEFTYFEDMTVDQIESVYRNLTNLRFAGGKVIQDTKDNDTSIANARKGAADNKKPTRGRSRHWPTTGITDGVKTLFGALANLRNKLRKIDGFREDDRGANFEEVYLRAEDGDNTLLELQRETFERYQAELSDINVVAINNSWFHGGEIMADNGALFKFSTEERLMIALYTGTESSTKELMKSFKLSKSDIMKIISTMTDQELQLVNSLWAMNETLFEGLAEVSIKHRGVAPKKLAATPFVINGVEMTGGHQTIFYEGQSEGLEILGDETTGGFSALQASEATAAKERVGGGDRKIRLAKENISRMVNENLRYQAFYQPSVEIAAIVNDPEYKQTIIDKHGEIFYDSYIRVLQNTISGVPDQDLKIKPIVSILRHLRKAKTAAVLHYSIRNAAQQVTSLPIAISEVGTQDFIEASMSLATNEAGANIEFVKSKSAKMRNRSHLVNREANEFINQIAIGGNVEKAWKAYTDHGFALQTGMDMFIAYPTWLAKYKQAMIETNGDERAAISIADSAVSESVGSGSDIHLGAAFQSTNTQTMKGLTQFMTWFHNYYQRIYRDTQGFGSFEHKRKIFSSVVYLPMLLGVANAAITMDLPADDEEYAVWAARQYAKFVTGLYPIIGDVLSAIDGWQQTGNLDEATGAMGSAVRLATSDKEQTTLKTTSDIIKIASKAVILPGAGAVTRAIDVIDQKNEGENMGAGETAARVLIGGKVKN
ncbi:hypothetical protein OAO65_02220 [Flavobacteriales bacterium]|nr:hypothetical protein [Flavobacteriales bacterium]